jgi:hypothetical protein
MDNKPQNSHRPNRQDRFITTPNYAIKISTFEGRIPNFSYSVGQFREDRDTKEKYFAPFVRHSDLPSVIKELERLHAENDAIISRAKAKEEQDKAKDLEEEGSWRTSKSKGDRKLQRQFKQGVKQATAPQDKERKALVDSERQKAENRRVFEAALASSPQTE